MIFPTIDYPYATKGRRSGAGVFCVVSAKLSLLVQKECFKRSMDMSDKNKTSSLSRLGVKSTIIKWGTILMTLVSFPLQMLFGGWTRTNS